MSQFVLVFRSPTDRTPGEGVEAEWSSWFQDLGTTVVDWGNRVGRASGLGNCGAEGTSIVLSGYVVIEAADFDAAVKIANGCPALKHGGGVEVGEAVPA